MPQDLPDKLSKLHKELNVERRKNLGLARDLKAALKKVGELEGKIQSAKIVADINKHNSRRKPGWGTDK